MDEQGPGTPGTPTELRPPDVGLSPATAGSSVAAAAARSVLDDGSPQLVSSPAKEEVQGYQPRSEEAQLADEFDAEPEGKPEDVADRAPVGLLSALDSEDEEDAMRSKGDEENADKSAPDEAITDGSQSAAELPPLPALRRTRSSAAATSAATGEASKGPPSPKRSSGRLRDPEFAAKHKAFLQKVTAAESEGEMETGQIAEQQADKVETEDSNGVAAPVTAPPPPAGATPPPAAPGQKRPAPLTAPEADPPAKRRKDSKSGSSGQDGSNDCYCWICHKEGEVICCETCPRVFHLKCIQLDTAPTEDWVCPECVLIMTAENMDTRSRAMRLLNVDQLCTLLRHALSRMRSVSGVEPFLKPVDPAAFPAYKDYVAFPMDLQTMERNVKRKHYGSTEAFLADAKWVLHNCVIFNSTASKLTSVAKTLVKVCKHEMQEIENCPDCYINAHTRKDTWFIAACRIPHVLVWARLKGYPFWPGKVMRVNGDENVADIRFFGAHDRAWIPLKEIFLYSEEAPSAAKNAKRKGNLDGCLEEVALYIRAVEERFGKFEHAPPRTPFEPRREEEHIRALYPKCTLPFELGSSRRRARAYSFSGSERSQTGTPTPSEIAEMSATAEETKEDAVQKPEQESSNTNEEQMDVDPQEPQLEQPKLAAVKASAKPDDRAAVSPPCEVSSTTTPQAEGTTVKPKVAAATTVEPAKDAKQAGEESEKPKVKVAVIAETSEQVEIEGEVEEEETAVVEDEEEIEEIDDVEPESPTKRDEKDDKPKSDAKEETQAKSPKDPAEKTKGKESTTARTASEDEEIDDVEPEVEEILEDDDEAAQSATVDTSRLQAAGVSVTMVEKRKVVNVSSKEKEKPEAKPTEETVAKEAPAKKSDIGLGIGSDISVTVVQKKKQEGGEKAVLPRISVKSESELLEDPTSKDVVNVQIRSKPAAVAAKKPFPRKSTESPEVEQVATSDVATRGKSPPDPIVTISKVQPNQASTLSQQVAKERQASAAPPERATATAARLPPPPAPGAPPRSSPAATSLAASIAASTGAAVAAVAATQQATAALRGVHHPPPPAHMLPGSSLASMLGAPRPGLPPPAGAGYRGAPSLRPPTPSGAGASALMRMPGAPQAFRAAHPPPQATGPMGMPSLHPRPSGIAAVPPLPPAAGPVSEQMHKMAAKLADSMRGTLENLFREMAMEGSLEARVKALELELEKMQWRHQQELSEVKHNSDLILLEMRQTMEAEKQKVVADLKKQAEIDKQKAIAETKKKQWCAHCGKEAIFYCCWNTSYCDYPCQQAHWPTHMSTCAQNQSNQDEEGSSSSNAAGGGGGDGGPSAGQSGNSVPDGLDPTTAGGHFLSGQAALAAAAAAASSQPPSSRMQQAAAAAARSLQGSASSPLMPPMGGLNPRMMSQLGMRFPRAAMPPPAGHIRFPGSYFM